MKIAYISAGNLPSERANTIQVMKVCQAFTRLGHDVTLLSPASDQPTPGWDSLALHYGLSSPFNIQFLSLDPIWKRRSIAWKGIRQARKMGADLIYARALPPAVLGLLFNIPVILEMHQLPAGRFGPFWYRLFLKWQGRKFLVPITHALKQTLDKKFQPALVQDQVLVAPSGVDLDRYQDLPDSITARQLTGFARRIHRCLFRASLPRSGHGTGDRFGWTHAGSKFPLDRRNCRRCRELAQQDHLPGVCRIFL